ncbi:hypothetical protein ABB37_06905 [Leptomonas pyrrhocoris]|uniref:Uncharacterized protein n=1 Tax=Leptomonas pyrrhocoris TaxID=157538 RepID=A0A0N0VEA5_LEPPY|nr:hypothetical protein ABB37_06905 [Leptomonas pyrrhocoris]KPA77524.1 hypothetical protein ABB37_06905 [Leptomonas pyrrhocoris]|eukprot:XP_015655963.1 hypothetical protein ABB37_06905 [Leptomonas pyrrhocoris]
MPADFALAKECQLFRKDVDGVLALAAQLVLSSASPSTTTTTTTSSATTEHSVPAPSSSRLLAGPLIGAVLTEAHTRTLLHNALVRVLVPAQRHAALLQDNKYVRLANEAERKKRQEQQQQQQNPSGSANGTGGTATAPVAPLSLDAQQQRFRVGRVVGVVPKPGAKTPAAGTRSSAATGDPSQLWLLAVYVGECVEPFTVASLSDDVFTEAEHRIFVQSALSTNREDGSRRANVLPSQQPALLSREAAATVQQNIKDIRRVLAVADAVALQEKDGSVEDDAAAATVDAYTAEMLQRASGVKRPRDGDSTLSTNTTTAAGNSTADDDQDGASSPLVTFLGNGATSQAARLARLTDDIAARGQQLQQLRQLLHQKDQEVKSALQQQQQMEARHRGEVDAWRAKAEEQTRSQARAAQAAADSLEQRDRLLEEANTKLRRLAGMTTKYKQVVDAVATLLRRSSNTSGDNGGTPTSPDEILAALQHKSLV